jgi:nucleoside-triphosphatase THEP1
MPDPAPLASLLYAPNDSKADALAAFVAARTHDGQALGGMLIETEWSGPDTKCGLSARLLAHDRRLALARPHVGGIRVGRWVLLPDTLDAIAVALTEAAARPPAVVVVDKFGPLEGRGAGLAAPLAALLAAPVPLVVAVRREFAPAWQTFVAEAAPERLKAETALGPDADALEGWWHGLRAQG